MCSVCTPRKTGPVKIGELEPETAIADPVQVNSAMPPGAFMFLGKTPAEKLLTLLQIIAAALTIFLALRILLKKSQ